MLWLVQVQTLDEYTNLHSWSDMQEYFLKPFKVKNDRIDELVTLISVLLGAS